MKTEINSFEDACKYLNYDLAKCLPSVEFVPVEDQIYLVNHAKLVIIARALNSEYSKLKGLKAIWQPDWSDSSQYKYSTWFEVKANKTTPSGFGFSDTNCYYWRTSADCAARLLFPTSEIAIFFGTQFQDLHIIDRLGVCAPASVAPKIDLSEFAGEYSIEESEQIVAKIQAKISEAKK